MNIRREILRTLLEEKSWWQKLLNKVEYSGPGSARDEIASAILEKPIPIYRGEHSVFFDGVNIYWMTNGKAVKSWGATSGKVPWASRQVMARDQKLKSFGAIPETTYKLGGIQQNNNFMDPGIIDHIEYFYNELAGVAQGKGNLTSHNFGDNKNPFTQIAWGNFRIPIIGGKHGRGSFYIHGGTMPGSSGCIDLGNDNMDDFVKFAIAQVGRNMQNVPLTVQYKEIAQAKLAPELQRVEKSDEESSSREEMGSLNSNF